MPDRSWTQATVHARCQTLSHVAGRLADMSDSLIASCSSNQRIDPVETITAELFPLCAALKWIGKNGPKVLRSKRLGAIGRPAWLWGVHSQVHRQPMGQVLILAAWNYPLLLPGVQAAQALAAGNRVLLKPAVGCEAATLLLVEAFTDAGVPREFISVLDSSNESAISAIDQGVDLIVLTGGVTTGQKVMAQAARTLTPVIMELSGCDGVIVTADADLDRAADSIVFGMQFNSGATCIAPRRLIAVDATIDALIPRLRERLQDAGEVCVHPSAAETVCDTIAKSVDSGCVDLLEHFDETALRSKGRIRPVILDGANSHTATASSDLFAPVISLIRVQDLNEAIRVINDCRFRLAASVFGPLDRASEVADQLQVGTVVINDLIVPTADPRLPFGGRGASGFGVTRGAEGLLAMTTPKVVARRYGKLMPHLKPRQSGDQATLTAALTLMHGSGWKKRLSALRQMAKRG
ncbi:aldehyde dehydrogenase family protein [Rubripirellula amarantea]|nr:aldehyde dehydrogenase family protein [Rubripirellula amarantea]